MSVRRAWTVRQGSGAVTWFEILLVFGDGARVEALAAVSEEGVCLEDVRGRPGLALEDLAVLAEWLEGPLADACAPPEPGAPGARRARPAWPRGREGRRLAAREYRAAQERGADPVLAVMRATGYSRRTSLRLIGQARDEGFLTPRRARR
ncbi:DUF6214 family protein [Streptomyces leeuwenhoekii]|uniref:Uncharacterized protein n=1 Tax=Streptomyces leeuwenhoekii TaxID=1437453 RepID=A0A0F7W414_STRLW|nr:DUF6214 family protein [Streptomyces leeuwenhoekii]KMS79207.1 hypothetical protein ACH49_12755 [Streptomyces leeuwenhoekii]CQR65463.1 Conserved Hypothetical Protein [Streptomyces leeuwenhoekii]